MSRLSRIRWSIRARDALFLVLLTAGVVALTAGVYLAQLARVTLESAQGEAEILARETFALSKEILSRPSGAGPWSLLAADPELRALMEAQVGYSRHVVYTALADSGGRVRLATDGSAEALPDEPPLLDELVEEDPPGRIRALWRHDLYEVRKPMELDGEPFGTVRLGVATALLRREVETALRQGAKVGAGALVLALLVGLGLAALTLRPVRRLRGLLGRLREGDLDPGEPVRFTGEFEELAAELTEFGRDVRAERLRLLAEKASLEQLAANLEDPVLVLNRRREVLFANPAGAALLGTPAAEVLGRPLEELLRRSHPVAELVDRAATEDTEVRNLLLSLEKGDDTAEYLASVFPVSDREDGERVGFVLLLEDLEAVRILRSLIRYGARMISLKRLSSGMVHELKNPLHSLSLHVELLRQVLRDPPARAVRSLEILAREIRRLDRLVEDFRRFSRPEDLEVRPLDVRDLLGEAADLMRPELEAGGIGLELDLPPEPLEIDGDPERLRQALLNVIRNAEQAMPEGGRLRIAAAAEPPVFARVSVTDTGDGIDPYELDRIFQLYYSTKADGSGVGLFMVHRIVQEHGGMVSATSKPGEGTGITFHLPLRGMLGSSHGPEGP